MDIDLRQAACIALGAHRFENAHEECEKLGPMAFASCDERCLNCNQPKKLVFHYVNTQHDFLNGDAHNPIKKYENH